MKTYKEYLESVHAEKFPQVLDDDMSDSFDSWVSNLDNEETAGLIIDYINNCVKNTPVEKFIGDLLKDVNAFYF